MQYTLLIQHSANNIEAAKSAIDFAQTLIDKGHVIYRIFFYGDGCSIANHHCDYPDASFNPYNAWVKFFNVQNIEGCVCIAAANRRGLIDDQQAVKLSPPSASNVKPPFVLTGLGQLIEAGALSDRVISFR